MHTQFLTIPTLAFLAGLAGGFTSHFLAPLRGSGVHDDTVRARRIELVDAAGKTLAFLGQDEQQDTALVFVDENKRERAKFGVWPHSYTPKMVMTGGDGKERMVFHLSHVDDRPMILLRDHERTRVHLGFYQNDAPGPKDEDWGIRFYDPQGYEHTLAAVGMRRDWNDDKMEGFLYAQGKEGRTLLQPRP